MLLSSDIVQPFKAPKKLLKALDADVVGLLVAAAADIALVVDRKGVICDYAFNKDAFNKDALLREGMNAWIGKAWIDTVTVESRPKIEEMLAEVAIGALPRPRQVNHIGPAGQSIAVRYSPVPLGQDGRLVAVGRDLKAVMVLQQRLVEAQQEMEREYARLRAVESRYRFMFHMTSEPVLVIDAATLKVSETNLAAGQLLAAPGKRLTGQTPRQIFDAASGQAIETLLATVRAVGRAEEAKVQVGEPRREMTVMASLYRQDGGSYYLMRFAPAAAAQQQAARPAQRMRSTIQSILDAIPDGFAAAGVDGRILSANPAFLELAGLSSEEQARGELISRFIGRSDVDFVVLLDNLKEHGAVRRYSTVVRGAYGAQTDVDVSAVSVTDTELPCFGFVLHTVNRPAKPENRGEPPRSVEQMKQLIGRAPLKDVVRETTDVIERLCIQAALELTGDNRASAAEMLGLSRQSLYGKLRRYGIGGLGSGED